VAELLHLGAYSSLPNTDCLRADSAPEFDSTFDRTTQARGLSEDALAPSSRNFT
jgi:hypothetical protein